MSTNFTPALHTFRSPKFKSVVKDALSFFESTPVHPLPPPRRFVGAGVYALYYLGNAFQLYQPIAQQNGEVVSCPIYVGKAVPPGSRTGFDVRTNESADLFRRLREHTNSLEQAQNLNLEDFRCRFAIFESAEIDLIAPVESALIRKCRPLWNANVLSGFGIHTPGQGRFRQRRSKWDVIHPGRPWAARMRTLAASEEDIVRAVKGFLGG